jgi:hypothetical protein
MRGRRFGWNNVSVDVESFASGVIHVRVRRVSIRMGQDSLFAGNRINV